MPAYVVSSKVMSQQISEQTILVDMESGSYFGAKGVAAEIWEQVQAGAGAEEIGRHLAERYDADPERIRKDVEAFLARLLEKGLIRKSEE